MFSCRLNNRSHSFPGLSAMGQPPSGALIGSRLWLSPFAQRRTHAPARNFGTTSLKIDMRTAAYPEGNCSLYLAVTPQPSSGSSRSSRSDCPDRRMHQRCRHACGRLPSHYSTFRSEPLGSFSPQGPFPSDQSSGTNRGCRAWRY